MKALDELLDEIARAPRIKDFFIHKPSYDDIYEYENTMAGIDTTEKTVDTKD